MGKSVQLSIVLFFSAPLLIGCQSIEETTGKTTAVQIGDLSPTPYGYFNLCRSGSAVCHPRAGRGVEQDSKGIVQLTDGLRRDLGDVNRSVNWSIRQVADAVSVGKKDQWRVEPAEGDCEDFALTKKARLQKAGWPSKALLVALVKTRSGEDHAVLIVRTTEGDLVLDNMTSRIRPWQRSGYIGYKIQSPGDSWLWRSFV